jgi:hypothetical protein
MTLKCSEDGKPEDLSRNHAIYACHHCGRPVCQDHGLVVSADDAFDDSVEDSGDDTTSVKRIPQRAMHCKQCAEQDHGRVGKHPGWKDPKLIRAEEAARAARERAAAAAARAAQQQAPPQQPGPQYPGRGPQYPGQGPYPGPGPQHPGQGQYPGQPWPQQRGQWGQPQPGHPGYPRPRQPGQN